MSRQLAVSVAVLGLVLLAATGPTRSYEPGTLLGELPEAVTETSGLTEGSLDDGVLFTHNDSSDVPFDPTNAEIFAVTHTGELVATLHLEGVGVTDVEDIAWGPGPDGEPALYLADIGDNYAVRPQVVIYIVPEPELDATQRDLSVSITDVSTYTLTYPGPRRDAETLLVHPVTGELTIVTKNTTGTSLVFTAPRPTGAADAAVLTQAGTLDVAAIVVRESYNPAFPDNALQITGGEISHDGAFVVLRSYTEGHEWPLGADGDVVAAFASTPLNVVIPEESQGEAIAYRRDGRALLTSSENTRTLHQMVLASAASEPEPAPEPEPEPAPTLPATGGGLALAGAVVLLVASARRR